MSAAKISLKQALEYAKNAKDYARRHILKVGTQLSNNSLNYSSRCQLEDAVKHDIREYIEQLTQLKYQFPYLEKYNSLVYFETFISVTSKYSLGNCTELALQALDYILNEVGTSVNAEVYRIAGGDHVFLVINRDPLSNPQDPNTWGDVVICDQER